MDKPNIKQRLYKGILLVGACLSIICIIGNFISKFPILLSLKWIALFIITVTAYLLSGSKKYTVHIMFGVFLFLVCIFLPFAFFDSGGSNNNAIGYIFLLLISITYLFTGWRRLFLVIALIIVFAVLHFIEYYYPELISAYSDWNQFLDRMIQIPLLLFTSFLILVRFAKEYENVNIKLETYANYDELTGLFNRRMFNKAMDEAIKTKNTPVYLVLFDLDNFKKLNDRYGHYIGDKALIKLSVLLKESIDFNKNIISRWGGDEFAIIYYGDKRELLNKLEDIKSSFNDYVSLYEKSVGISVSIISFSGFDNASKILIAADEQLYNEKLKKH
jgi:diguanylate cyclase (GGDEF)-like protein